MMNLSKLAVLVTAIFMAQLAQAKPGPAQYGGHPLVRSLTISPDGKHVAMIANDRGNSIVTISKIGGGICKLGNGGNKVRGLLWANKDRLVVEVSVAGRNSAWPTWVKVAKLTRSIRIVRTQSR
jgi:hypothetical protein